MKTTTFLILMTVIFLFFAFGTWIFIAYHEDAHKSIYGKFGIDSKVSIGFNGGETNPMNITAYRLKCNDTCKSLNEMNEIVSYPILALIINLWLIVFVVFILLFIWSRKENKSWEEYT